MAKGIAPPDFSTDLGLFRLYTDDTSYEALEPPEAGFGDYPHNSDTEIEAFLSGAGDDIYQALGDYYSVLSDQAAALSVDIKDHDLSVKTHSRAEQLRASAKAWYAKSDASNDILEIFPTGPASQTAPWGFYGPLAF